MQFENIMKDIETMEDRMHMNERVDCHDMEKWLSDLIVNLKENEAYHEDYEDDLRNEARDYEYLYEEYKERTDDLENQIEWIKSMSAYGFSDWKMGKTKWD